MNTINNICILRLSAIGDVTHVLPVIATLKNSFPQAKITWVIGKLEYKLMKGLSGVDFIVFDKSEGWKAYSSLKNSLKNTTFDALLHMQYSFRGNRAAWKIKARNRIGFDKNRSRELHGLRLTHRINAVEKQHVLDSFMEFTKVLGVKKLIYEWDIPVSESDRIYAKEVINNHKLNVVISPFSSKVSKNWSIINYAKLIDYIGEKYNAHIILCGSPSHYEVETAKLIEQLAKYPVTNTTGKDTLKQLFALLIKVDLVISPDSGPMHMANAAKTPVIGLLAATTAKRSGAYLFQELAVDCFEEAANKFLNKPADDIRWGKQISQAGVMDLITAESVFKKVDNVLFKKPLKNRKNSGFK